jgi:hypothetical protein
MYENIVELATQTDAAKITGSISEWGHKEIFFKYVLRACTELLEFRDT